MATDVQHVSGLPEATSAAKGAAWLISLPLAMAAFTYSYLLARPEWLLQDGDTFWHIAVGRWIIEHRAVPAVDSFSYSMPGAPWTAHEWLSELVLAWAYRTGGWMMVAALAALCLSVAVALLTRALLRNLEPVYAFLFGALALFMAMGHALARPHLLAIPLLVLWTVELARASDEARAPRLWLLTAMVLWANLHAGFIVGIALAAGFAGEAVLAGWPDRGRMARALRSWGVFLVLAVAAALATPHGFQTFAFTWDVLSHDQYALALIGEWRSPDFQIFQPFLLWLIGGMALVLYQGLRLPPVRLVMLLALVYLALKHARNIELLGLLGPLLVAGPFGAQWRERMQTKRQFELADGLFLKLARPAGNGALALAAAGAVVLPAWIEHQRAVRPPAGIAPVAAVRAAQAAGVRGHVLNEYSWGGYLIQHGIPVMIDGRTDVYGDEFLKEFEAAKNLATSAALPKLLERYGVDWTLLQPDAPANALLDRMPGWHRLYADKTAVVHVRVAPDGRGPAASASAADR